MFSFVEIVAATVVLACAWSAALGRDVAIIAVILAALVAVQFGWLLPLLDVRVERVIQGSMPEPARFHDLYVAAELVKAGFLGYVAWRALRVHAAAA